MRLIHVLRPVALACALLLGGAQAAAAAAPLDPAYTVDLRAFLDRVGVYEKSLKALTQSSTPATGEFMTAMAAQMTPDKLYGMMLPVYARHITPEQARTLGALARYRQVPAAQRDAALAAMRAVDDKSGAEFRAAGVEMGTAFVKDLLARTIAEIRRCTAELAAHRESGYAVRVGTVGMPTMDRIVKLSVDSIKQHFDAADKVDRACSHALANSEINASELVTAPGVAQARRTLDECEHALETNQKEAIAITEELRASMGALNMPGKEYFAKGLDTGLRRSFEYALDDGERGRRYVGAQRSLLDLLEARRAGIEVRNNKFMFRSGEDMAEFRRIAGEIDGLKKEINDVIYERRQKNPIARGLDLHDNITAPQPAAQDAAQDKAL